jgi:hypothetical protein
MFAAGQAYVALSRVRSVKGLQVLGMSQSSIRTDPIVKAFYKVGLYCSLKNAEYQRLTIAWDEPTLF